MLDTDSVSYAIRGVGRVAERIVANPPSQICSTLGVTLVTNNQRHFSRVPALRIVNWL